MFILGWIFFGALTGWIASLLVHKRGQGCMVIIFVDQCRLFLSDYCCFLR